MSSLVQLKSTSTQLSLPDEHSESWRYTILEGISLDMPIAPKVSFQDDAADILLVNSSSVKGGLTSIAAAPAQFAKEVAQLYQAEPYDPMASWNLAACEDILWSEPKGSIYLRHHITAGNHAAHTRLVLKASEPSKIYLQLTSDGGGSLSNLHLVVMVKPNTPVDLVLEHNLNSEDTCVVTLLTTLEKDANVHITDLHLSGKTTRLTYASNLAGPGSEVTLNGILLGYDSRHSDTTAYIRHLAPHTNSNETYYSILNDSSSGAFTGLVYVEKDAQKIDAKQMNRALLLNDAARAYSRPHLEINADDVKCAHGASIGKLDPNAVFYLQTRGISLLEARRLLIEAFVQKVIDAIKDENMREMAQNAVLNYLEGVASHG